MVPNDSNGRERSFGLGPKPNWYSDHKNQEVTFILHGSIKIGGVISNVDLENGDVILKPYLGKDYSSGKELEALVDLEARVQVSSIVVKLVHSDNYFKNYISVSRSP